MEDGLAAEFAELSRGKPGRMEEATKKKYSLNLKLSLSRWFLSLGECGFYAEWVHVVSTVY